MNNLNIVLENLKNNYKLKRFYSSKKFFRKKNFSKDLDITNYLKFGKFNDIVLEFNKLFDEKLNSENKNIFKKEIKKLQIIEVNEIKNYTGKFDSTEDKIELYAVPNHIKIGMKERLMHELLHSASKKYNGLLDGLSCALETEEGYHILGNALNEGYTELLNQKYFSKNINTKYYYYEKILASGIERLLGNRKMEKFYFNTGLADLIENLGQYENMEYIVGLINQMDKMSNEQDSTKRYAKFSYLKNEISNLNKIKLDNEYKNNLINYDQYQKNLFYDVFLYKKYNFIYSDKVNVVNKNDNYEISGAFGKLNIEKESLKDIYNDIIVNENNTKIIK